eukprot:Gregarina_sp_Pseudo_9__5345@NODE_636_length_2443_cov_29_971298_g600_i0_p2_GENE_NODE_636_length_2443_cov_29_971298_g600_i0NODE_636_length_2443_cov_29_971298_g600_i0_p2_ORF_typecomplete_len232_score15_81_NODE_636_length_2443_cov_29_971298_g600_i03698
MGNMKKVLILAAVSAIAQVDNVNIPLFCYNATGGFDCSQKCSEACGYYQSSSTIDVDCLGKLPSHCSVLARPYYQVDLLPDFCSTAQAFRFHFTPLPEAVKPPSAGEDLTLSRATLLVQSAAFTWANCNATQIWTVGQLVSDPTEEQIADCSLPNYGFGERIAPGDFVQPLQFELDLTKYFSPKFDGIDITQQDFLFQLSIGTDNTKCSGTLDVANLSLVQTVSLFGTQQD